MGKTMPSVIKHFINKLHKLEISFVKTCKARV